MISHIENYYLDQDEPTKSCFLALRKIIKDINPAITEEWKYKMPFFYFKNKMFCYLWYHKKFKMPYIGVVKGNEIDHPLLIAEKRAVIKILLIDPEKDIEIQAITEILNSAISCYKS